MGRERELLPEWLNENILWEYDLPAEKAIEVRGGFKIETAEGRRLVKLARTTPEAITLAYAALQYLRDRGFHQVAPIALTKYGDPYIKIENQAENQLYYLTDWISGKECQLEMLPQLKEAVATLARMQAAVEGFSPPPTPSRERWHQWPGRYRQRLGELERCREMVEQGSVATEFDTLFLTEVGSFIEQGYFSLEWLDEAGYPQLVEEARRTGGICHSEFLGRNLIRNRRGEIYVVNFDNCQLDLRVFDLGRLLSRVLPRYSWDLELTVGLLDLYQERKPLSAGELMVLISYLNFPQRFWRLARRHYLEGVEEENEVRQLQDLLLEQPVKEDFVLGFLRHYRLSR